MEFFAAGNPSELTVVSRLVLSMPILVLWSSKISSREKIILISIFSATTLIMVIAIIRVLVGTTYDREMNIAWLCFWSFVELNTGNKFRSTKNSALLWLSSVSQLLLYLALPLSGSSSSPPKTELNLVGQHTRLHTPRCCRIPRAHILDQDRVLLGISIRRSNYSPVIR